jgi:hypothetical protein
MVRGRRSALVRVERIAPEICEEEKRKKEHQTIILHKI